MRRFLLLIIGLLFIGLGAFKVHSRDDFSPHYRLSEYGFFRGQMNELKPVPAVLPYDLVTPLFTDYAHKTRFIYIPKGEKAAYNDSMVFDFPTGTVLIKNFFYYMDERKKDKRRILETRLLVNTQHGWEAWPYIWNEKQDDAFLDVAGDLTEVEWKDHRGRKTRTDYLIPNKNQCKGCHLRGDKIMPIGPAARHLNRTYNYPDGTMNQLKKWQTLGILGDLPSIGEIPANVNWEDPDATLDARARSYLDINCGHCHRKQGPGNTSGLFLDIHERKPARLGFLKPPVAAGRATGNRDYDIVPGDPDASILLYRMESTDPGIKMPEVGRSLAHKEGVELIRSWIDSME